MFAKGEDERRTTWEFGVSRCKVLYTGWINKAPVQSTENYIQYSVINHSKKEYEKEEYKTAWKDDYRYNCHFAVQQKLIWHCKSTILQLKKKNCACWKIKGELLFLESPVNSAWESQVSGNLQGWDWRATQTRPCEQWQHRIHKSRCRSGTWRAPRQCFVWKQKHISVSFLNSLWVNIITHLQLEVYDNWHASPGWWEKWEKV